MSRYTALRLIALDNLPVHSDYSIVRPLVKAVPIIPIIFIKIYYIVNINAK